MLEKIAQEILGIITASKDNINSLKVHRERSESATRRMQVGEECKFNEKSCSYEHDINKHPTIGLRANEFASTMEDSPWDVKFILQILRNVTSDPTSCWILVNFGRNHR